MKSKHVQNIRTEPKQHNIQAGGRVTYQDKPTNIIVVFTEPVAGGVAIKDRDKLMREINEVINNHIWRQQHEKWLK